MVRTFAGSNSTTLTIGGPPAATAVAAAQVLPVGTAVSASQPSKDLTPGERAQVLEGVVRHAEAEVGGPAPQHPIESVQQDLQREVDVLSAQRPHLVLDDREGLLRRVRVDVVPLGALLPVALDVPAEEVQALVFSELIFV
jgi:hypothetical protein